jgi:hypothetical protein
MPTIWAYAEQLAAGDTGRWHDATRRAAILLAPTRPVLELPHRMPVHHVLVQTTALIVLGLAARRHDHVVTCAELAAWAADHAVPCVPPTSPEVTIAVRRQQSDLAALLRAAGHQVPDPGLRSLHRHSPDPVVRQWHDLADTDDETITAYGVFPGPLLTLGIAAMADTFGPAIV